MNRLLVKPATRWYEQVPHSSERCTISDQLVHKLSQECVRLLQDEAPLYQTYKEQSASRSDFRWIEMVKKKGSLQDRTAAYTLLIQDSPVHNIDSLDTLVQWVSPKGKRECFLSIDALVDLFLQYLLPPTRKLTPFEYRPLDKLDMSKRADQSKCLLWYFEGQLKKKYMRFLENIEKLGYDKVEASKSKTVKTLFTLLCENPEQEQFLLTRLVNKFGDPMRKIAAKTSHVLSELTNKHPAMKPIVLNEVESLVFRKNISPKAQYYALCYLSTVVLSDEEYDLAFKLVQIYLNFFKMCVKDGEADTKLMSVLLTGINRAHPFCATDQELISRENEDVLFRLIYMASLPIAIQCLMLLFQVLSKKESGLTARFYSALYKKIQDPAIAVIHHQLMMFNLIYKAVKRDEEKVRVIAFIKRMLQLCLTYPPNLACSMLLIVSHILKERPHMLLNYPKQAKASEDASADPKEVDRSYDSHTDNPLKANAEKTLCYELYALSKHYHPSVSLFATEILNHTDKGVEYFGDPLKDFSLMHFLDRFVYRNPKAQSQDAHDKIFGKAQKYEPKGIRSVSVGSAAYMNRHEKTIPVDEAFLYKYFVESGRRTDGSGVNGKRGGTEMEDLDSDEADEFLGDINNHIDLDDEADDDFYSEFKDGKRRLADVDDAAEDEESEEFEEGMDDDFSDREDGDIPMDDDNSEYDAEEEEDDEDNFEDEEFGGKPRGKPIKRSKKTFEANEEALATEKLAEIFESNRLGDSASLNALSATTKASNKVSDSKQLEWERKRHHQLFGKKKSKGSQRFKKGKGGIKKHIGRSNKSSVIKLTSGKNRKDKKAK